MRALNILNEIGQARVFICDKRDVAGCDNFGATRQFRDCLLQILALTATNTLLYNIDIIMLHFV